MIEDDDDCLPFVLFKNLEHPDFKEGMLLEANYLELQSVTKRHRLHIPFEKWITKVFPPFGGDQQGFNGSD